MVEPAEVDALISGYQDEEAKKKARRVLGLRTTNAPDWVDIVDLVSEPIPDHDWVIEGLVERQGRVLLAADEEAGKSLIALTLAVQAAAGLPVLEVFPVNLPRTVMYVDLEMGRSSLVRRARGLKIQANLERDGFRILLRPDGIELRDAKERAQFLQKIESFRPELLIVDPFYKLSRGDSLYESEVKPALMFLDHLRHKVGCAVILLHHLRKPPSGGTSHRLSSDVFGASALRWWPETILIIDRDKGVVTVRKDRDGIFVDRRTWPLKWGGHWPISLGDPIEPDVEDVFRAVEQHGPITANALRKKMRRRAEDVYGALRKLEIAKRIDQIEGMWQVIQ
jgi:hypothetical protein